jgi:hypothetical protein
MSLKLPQCEYYSNLSFKLKRLAPATSRLAARREERYYEPRQHTEEEFE